MVGSAAKPQTKQKLVFCAGPSEQRAAERSADERSEAEAPKKGEKAKLLLLFRPLIAQGDWVGCPDLDQDFQCNFA